MENKNKKKSMTEEQCIKIIDYIINLTPDEQEELKKTGPTEKDLKIEEEKNRLLKKYNNMSEAMAMLIAKKNLEKK